MNSGTERTINIALAWCGPLFVLGYIISWGLMGHNIPPPNVMGMSGEQLVAEYYGKYPEIGPGMIACCVIGLLYLPWTCLLASMLRGANGELTVLSLMELTGGLLTAWALAWCPAMWAACSLLVHTVDPGVIRLVHVATWFVYDCTFLITTIQITGLSLYTILNTEQKIFPAWAGWCALATGIIFFPLVLLPFVHEGPFKLPGLWNYFIVFGTWLFAFFGLFSYFVLKAVSAKSAPSSRRGDFAFEPRLS